VIAGVIIDFSQVMTRYFIEKSGTGGRVSITIMKGLDIGKTYSPAGGSGIDGLLNIIISLFGGIIMMLVTAFVFFAGAILMFTRVIVLWFL